ncbi:hypothetical protein H7347_06800 [Corynebacterium sp. zg-331]|uniref:hypothetical protein n=1 Tax=unclassified Corynebacterium TaxID=2624378 RepID=UPI00128CACA8|nr:MULTISPECIES: hypothetical protein [unclassified Corynebacterium]MBC3186280.1 hypothetical protein [Corynebacterium sp. zg-331]MPV52769.1 hypothetical protein [Corynebacterium sp. zg331]
MSRITGTLKATDGMPTEGTITAWSVDLRPAGKVAITSERRTTRITQGQFTFDNLAPGPTRFTITGNNIAHDLVVTIPDSDVNFTDLLSKVYTWEPEVISEVQKTQAKAETAARRAEASRDEARTAATQAKAARDGATALRDQAAASATQAGRSATEADGAAQRAQQAASTAGTSATSAGQAATRAMQGQSAAEGAARDAENSATQAGRSATETAGQITRAAQEADRSEEAARRAVAGADRIGTAEAVTAARTAADAAAQRAGEQATRASGEADRAEQAASTAVSGISPEVRADIDAKATKAEVAEGLGAKADKAHKHVSADITDSTSVVNKGNQGKLLAADSGGDLNVRSRIYVYPDGRIYLGGTNFQPNDAVNRKFVNDQDNAVESRLTDKIDAKADIAALGTKADKVHTHVSADITDAVDGLTGDGGKLVRIPSSGVMGLSTTIVMDSQKGKITSNSPNGIIQHGTPTDDSALTNKGYVDREVAKKADATALEAKAAKIHKHVSADITDAVDAEAASQSATYANRLVRLDNSGNLCAKPPKTGGSVATKKYVDDEVKKAAPVNHTHSTDGISGLSPYVLDMIQKGISSPRMLTVESGWATFYRIGNMVTVKVHNGGSSIPAVIPAGFLPVVEPCYAPVTWLSDPVGVVLINIDRSRRKIFVERAPSASNLVHGTAVYMTAQGWPES